MLNTLRHLRACAVAALALAPCAQAQYLEDFECYAPGSAIEGQGGFVGWGGVNQNLSRVSSAEARSGQQSLRTPPGADTVKPLSGIDSGLTYVSAYTYIPSTTTGQRWLVLLNEYSHTGPFEWAAQIALDSDTGLVACDCGAAGQVTAPLVFDAWTELRYDIDLDGDLVTVSYNSAPLASYAWSGGPFGDQSFASLALEAINLFCDFGATGVMYWDDIEVPNTAPGLGTNSCGPAVLNSTGQPGEIQASGSAVAADNDLALTAVKLPPNQFGYFITSATQGFTANPGGSQGDLCLAGTLGRFVQQVQQAGAAGDFCIQVDLAALPQPLNHTVIAGETWNFQAWYRDFNPTPTSNFTDAVAVTFL